MIRLLSVGSAVAFLWAQSWSDVAGGVDNSAEVLYPWQGALYVGGRFQYVQGTALQAQGIARFVAGQGWQRVGPGQGAGGTGHIHVMTEWNGKLIVGGEFSGIGNSSAQNLAAYDPTTNTWSAVGGGVSGPVYALAVYDDELLVGGNFTQVNMAGTPQTIFSFARWTGSQWLAPDPNNPSQLLVGGVPRAFVPFQNKLYVAGNFVAGYYNDVNLAYLAIWDKSAQQLRPAYAPGQGPNNNIWAAVVWNNKLYLGGDFTLFGNAAGKLVAFDGTSAQSVPGAPTSGRIQSLLAVGNDLYVAGSFTSLGNGTTVNRVAKLSSTGTWSTLGSGLGATIVTSLAWYNNTLFAGGNFTQDGSGSVNLSRIASFGGVSGLESGPKATFMLFRDAEGNYQLRATGPVSEYRVRLLDVSGRTLWEKPIEPTAQGTYPIPLPSPGLYLLRVWSPSGEVQSFRLSSP